MHIFILPKFRFGGTHNVLPLTMASEFEMSRKSRLRVFIAFKSGFFSGLFFENLFSDDINQALQFLTQGLNETWISNLKEKAGVRLM